MSLWFCKCHGLHGPQSICRQASRATVGRDAVAKSRYDETAASREMAENTAPDNRTTQLASDLAPASRHEIGVPQDDSQ